ncbi:MAG: hypothetical protein A2750_02830 [Candidatus Yanofskybacteria bacterium RIFCSPHIGHO2_01_FULL_45_42]|uniref:ABC transporter n=3 Tax=Candidatus Yanofskyibacteriota TaxID=1752733 RepID=A0A1F8F5H9_9BACT|nr:MAG: hypothetical protein A2750_02830 [Candidatus Yanofskybacteria bacterium RIFCSPHIGHO2_01_FULL_45_42]OGN15791.1 MAG: hypothetical protein A3C81_01775 [Candidatus Yanofskybacteria bacterium RIFCSPHIGHO2_02_FULL_46_19]OGN26959.1 MAG: hypothetical protein A3B17_01465 [Candidatus Yanofskybacteria bacterium RIFCSPLOWO2_01_FULL_45_72]OGN31567.1 MAG: hypothetical protein A3J01_02645 [Candidatus Yanofskybacteria bacterium RIFCSPLOWO2_02_FULL_45_18]
MEQPKTPASEFVRELQLSNKIPPKLQVTFDDEVEAALKALDELESKEILPEKNSATYVMAKRKRSSFWRVLGLLKDHKKTVVVLVFLAIIIAALNMVVPFIIKYLVDIFTGFFIGKSTATMSVLIWAASGILIATVLGQVFESIYDYKDYKLAVIIRNHIHNMAFEKYLRLHALFHHESGSGSIIGKIDRGASSTYTIIEDFMFQTVLPQSLTYIAVVSLLLWKNITIGFLTMAPLPIYLLVTQFLASKVYKIQRESNDIADTLSKEAYDVASNVFTVKKYGQENEEIKNQIKLQNRIFQKDLQLDRYWRWMRSSQAVISMLGRLAVIIGAGLLVFYGKNTVGDFVLFVTLYGIAYGPMSQLSLVVQRVRKFLANVEKMFDILDEPIKIKDKDGATALMPLERELEFREVSFKYSEDKNWALKNLSIKIPAGQIVALVGRSGSGKTTFVNLLLRSYDPQKGSILVDGHDLRDIKQASLLGQIAVVPQEVDLFSRTIKENIAYGNPDASEADIVKAAKLALCHDFTIKLPEKYDTVVGERGIKLSGGERQRVGIARAILRDPKILILDEATSHLDTESERLIQEATDAVIKNRTSIIIAHRFSTILKADMIFVFSKGELEAAGTRDELLHKSPTFKRLYSLQFSE